MLPQQGDRPPRGRDADYIAEAPPPNPRPEPIFAICGGPSAGGESLATRKRYARATCEPGAVMPITRPRGPSPLISFSDDDLEHIQLPHDDALVTTGLVANREVHRILVDNGSSTDILFFKAFEKMGIPLTQLTPSNARVIGLSSDLVKPVGHWETTL